MTVTTVTSGQDASVSENGTDQLIKVESPSMYGNDFQLTIPRPGDCPAGRRFQIWLTGDFNGWPITVMTGNASDNFVLSSYLYDSDRTDYKWMRANSDGYSPIMTIYSDGDDSWYSDVASYSGAWFPTNSTA